MRSSSTPEWNEWLPLEMDATDRAFICEGPRSTLNSSKRIDEEEYKNMLWTVCVVLFVLWALGMVSSYTMGGLVHLLLVVALVIIVVNLIQGRRSIV